MSVVEHYQALLDQKILSRDGQQVIVIANLQDIYDKLVREDARRKSVFKSWRKNITVRGLYLYGGVGIGKTMLLDCFYHELPFSKKMRMHFYQFMRFVHNELHGLQGEENPLTKIADNIANQTLVVCLDEFIITDIVDALVLKNLISELFSRGVCIVATSNVPPNKLCKKAWQETFAPAVMAMNENMKIMHVATEQDYRKAINHSILDSEQMAVPSNKKLSQVFAELTKGQLVIEEPIILFARAIPVVRRSDEVAWFRFVDLCSVPRSAQDYLELGKQYKSIFISDIPVIPVFADNVISLFIRLVDVLYDAKIKLYYSSEAPVNQLYPAGRFVFEYARTCSRLMDANFAPLINT